MTLKWKSQRLPMWGIIQDVQFQPRVAGLNKGHLKSLRAALGNGATLPPVKVAKVGDAHYLIDGFHRMAAWKAEGATVAEVEVATMSKRDALAFALAANTANGLPLSQKDKAAALEQFCRGGLHLTKDGTRKTYRQIASELGGIYDFSHVRRRMVEWGQGSPELDEADGYKAQPWNGSYANDDIPEWELEAMRLQEAFTVVRDLEGLATAVGVDGRGKLAAALRDLAGRVERGDPLPVPSATLDI